MRRGLGRWGLWLTVPVAVAVVAVLGARTLAPDPCLGAVDDASEPPTIVVVMFDDLDVTLAEAMPGWEEIASRGVSFDHAFVTTPLCCPSRVSFLTGKYAHTHGVYGNRPPLGGYERAAELDLHDCALPVWLDRAGYETAVIGKYLNGHSRFTVGTPPAGWDDWQALHGGRYQGYRLDDNGTVTRPRQYSTDEIADRAVRALERAEARPLFLLVAPTPPHVPLDPAPRHAESRAPAGVEPGRYRLMLAGMELLHRIIEAIPPDAYLVITSDNGFHTEPTWGKGMPWDSDTRVPLIVIGPDIAPGERDELVANIDLTPTIAAWAGIRPPESLDGVSLEPLLRGDRTKWRDELTLEMVGQWSAIRTVDTLTVTWSDGRVERLDPAGPGS
jgi:N-acetylglucosamine-6-sulfatase